MSEDVTPIGPTRRSMYPQAKDIKMPKTPPAFSPPPRSAPKENPLGALAGMLNRKPPYISVVKALNTIGIKPVVRKENGEDFLVIPLSELIYKEWQHMSEASLPDAEDAKEPKDA